MIPRLHLVTDDGILAREGFLGAAEEALEAGGASLALHLRGPRSAGGHLFSLAGALRGVAAEAGATLLVNDRLDVALALDLHGAHLGQRSLPPRVARELLGKPRLLGLSVHGVEEARRGEGSGVDFFLVGTIFSTPSHPERAPAGPRRLQEVGQGTSLPLLAIGGVSPERVVEVLEEGAHGVAVRGGVWDVEDPAGAVRVYLDRLASGPGDTPEAGAAEDGSAEGSG